MPSLILRNYESKKRTLLNTDAIVTVSVESNDKDYTATSPLRLVIFQTNSAGYPSLYVPINELGDEDTQQADPEAALLSFQMALRAAR